MIHFPRTELKEQIHKNEDQIRLSQQWTDSPLHISTWEKSGDEFKALSETQQVKTEEKLQNLSLFCSKTDNKTGCLL